MRECGEFGRVQCARERFFGAGRCVVPLVHPRAGLVDAQEWMCLLCPTPPHLSHFMLGHNDDNRREDQTKVSWELRPDDWVADISFASATTYHAAVVREWLRDSGSRRVASLARKCQVEVGPL